MTLEWLHVFFSALTCAFLAWVVWRLMTFRPPVVTHCLITNESECLLLRDPTILCAECRTQVVARAHESRARAHD
jgi:hypothetical protein